MTGLSIKSVRIELDRAGVGQLLRSHEMQADLDRRGEAVKAAAQGRSIVVEGDQQIPVTVTSAGGSTRARTHVTLDHPAGLAVEAKYRLLVGSLDAAR